MWQGQKASHTGEAHWLELKPRARELRKDATLSEARLWQALRGKQLGVKFRRQHPINRYIVDFYSVEAALAIEVDGAIHQTQVAEDASRQAYLEANNVSVLRFTNDEVIENFSKVLDTIRQTLQHSGTS
jgi:leucyl-tRNA synthetase